MQNELKRYVHTENADGVIIDYDVSYMHANDLSENTAMNNELILAKFLSTLKSDILSEYITFKVVIRFSDDDTISIYPDKLFNSKLAFRIEDVVKVIMSNIASNGMVLNVGKIAANCVYIPPCYTKDCKRRSVIIRNITLNDERNGVTTVFKPVYDLPFEDIQTILSNSLGCSPINTRDGLKLFLNYNINIHNVVHAFRKQLPCMHRMRYNISDVIMSTMENHKCSMEDLIYMGLDINGCYINTDVNELNGINKKDATFKDVLHSVEEYIVNKVIDPSVNLEGMLERNIVMNTNCALLIFTNGFLYFKYDLGNIEVKFFGKQALKYFMP